MITASAPGSLMITGEHAVLHGARALVGAINPRVTVSLSPRADRTVRIQSALGFRETTLDAPDTSSPFQFITRAIAGCAPQCPSGFELAITADMPPDVGLGSSAAVTVATLTALHAWCHHGYSPCPETLHRQALAIVRDVQGTASGADLAAAVWGGILLYTQTPEVLHRYTDFPDITLLYAGYKTKTADVIRQVETRRAHSPDGFRDLYVRMDACTAHANLAFACADWKGLANALNLGQTLMTELGVCDDALADIIRTLRSTPGISAAKISGSGLGDCVLGLGCMPVNAIPYRQIPVHFSALGATLENL